MAGLYLLKYRLHLRAGVFKTVRGVDDVIGPCALLGIWHLAGQHIGKGFWCHPGSGEYTFPLDFRGGGDNNRCVHRGAGLEQQGNIKDEDIGIGFGNELRPVVGHQRVDSFLYPIQKLRIIRNRLAQKISVDVMPQLGSLWHQRCNPGMTLGTSPVQSMHGVIGIPGGAAEISEHLGRGRFAHADRAGQADDNRSCHGARTMLRRS